MLYAKVSLAVKQDRTYSNRRIMLYRGDNNVEIEFTLGSTDYILSECKYIQAILTRPYAPSIFSDLFELNDNTFVLTITGDMIDELTELETYSMQLILFDETQDGKITLPPCYDIFDVKKPLATEAARINWAAINYDAVATADEDLGDIFNDKEYNKTEWRDGDVISDIRMNKIEEALSVISHRSGGSGGVSAVYISSDDPEVLVLNEGFDLLLNVNFVSPNPGKGTLNVAVGGVIGYTTSIQQSGVQVSIPERLFSKGSNTMSIYVIDKFGGLSNTIMFEVRYGSLEFKTDFDQYTAYNVSESTRFYFTPSSADTSVGLTFYMSIDGEVQNGVSCTSDVRNYYTFPTSLGAGRHKCAAYIVDDSGNMSNQVKFNLILLSETNLVVASDADDVTIEEGLQLSLDFKVYMKNRTTFITEVYVDDKLVNTGKCGLEKSYYKTSSLTEGTHTITLKAYNETRLVSDSISWNVIVTASTYTMIQPANAGLIFSASAYNRTNADEGREVWDGNNQEGEVVNATLTNFSFNDESGWVDDSLIISGVSHVEVPVKPLANNAKTGFTLDIEFLSKQIGVEDAEVLTLWDNNKNCGVKITTENIILRSAEGHECNLYFSDNEFTNAIMVIDRQEKKAKIYLNGVMCHAFHLSDYIANGVTYYEDFSVDSNVYLGGKDKNGYSKIKNIRIYDVALTTNEVLNNYISNKKDKAEQQALVEFQKGNDLPTMTIYCDFSGLGKDDKKPCKIVYSSTDELKYGKSFVLDHKESQLQYQGTSSMAYPIKNYRINLRDSNGDKLYYAFPGGQPECRFTLKADFMSSGHWQNTGFTKWVNDNLYNYKTNDPKTMNPKKWFDINNGGSLTDTRECIYGFPCRLILVNDGTSALNQGQNEPLPGNTKDMGIFNFNHDKDCAATIGLDQVNFPNCASYEIAANSDTSAGAFMSYDTVNPSDVDELGYLKQSFEMRFPDEKKVPEGWGFLGVGEEGTGVKALIDWVDKSTDEEFVRDFEQHFHKDYTLRYFLMVMVCGMVDNLGKNLMLDTWDNKIFMPRFYDCDTICSYDNSGDIKFDVDIEMEQGYWNTSSSRLWTRVRDLMHADLVEKYNDMRQNGLSYESLMSYFYDEQIAKIPQKYYNMDFDVKYAPFADSYMGMAHGDGYEHLKRWLKKRLIFCDTLFDYAPSYNNDVLTIRANTTEPMTIEIETYTPLYQHVSWYNGQMDKKKIDGKIAVSFSGTAMAETDQEVLIYGGSNVKKITGLQSMNPNQMLIGYATKISEIDASNCSILADINSDGANLSPHTYLNNVNLANCAELSGNLRLDNSQLIRNVDISGTAISGIQLPTSVRNLETLKLSEDVSSLTLRDANLLSELNLPANIEYLNLINVPKLKTLSSSSSSLDKLHTLIMENPTINPISNITSKAPNLKHVRLIGLDISCSTSQMESLLNVKGVDSFGNEIPIAQAVSGKVALSECSTDIEQQFKTAFPLVEFTVTSYVTSFSVTFVDGDGNTLYTTRVIQNGEAVYVGDTPTKTSTAKYDYEWSGWDRQLKPILSDCVIAARFNSILRYYTIRFINSTTNEVISEKVLAYGATISKPDKPSDANVWIPTNSIVTGDIDFISKYLPYPEDTSIFNFGGVASDSGTVYYVSIKNQKNLPSSIILPFETPDGKPVYRFEGTNNRDKSYFSGITELYIPETICDVGWYAFQYMGVEEINLPKSVTKITSSNKLFAQCPNLIKVNAPGITIVPAPSSNGSGMFSQCPKLKYVTFGSKEYPFTSWNEYSSSTTSNHHLYVTNDSTLSYVNLVTANGKQEDVTFKTASFTQVRNSDKMIFSKAPIEIYTDELGLSYQIYDEMASVTGYTGTATEIEIPTTIKGATVKTIDDNVFSQRTDITKVVAQSVTSLGYRCFYNCSNLTSIEIPKATSLGGYCFSYCQQLTSVNLPKATSLGNNCFYACTRLTSMEIPEVTSLGTECFYSCSKLTSINLPKATSLGVSCFHDCSGLTSIELPEVTSVGATCFRSCTSLTSMELPKATSLGSMCFHSCTALASIEIPEATSLSDNCFFSCANLTSIEIPKVTSLGYQCFIQCTGLTSIELPNVTSLSGGCFRYCSGLTSIKLPKATSLGQECFGSCSALSSIELPLVTDLPIKCFRDCLELETISIPSVTTLGRECLCNVKVSSISLPNVTTLAGSHCFAYNYNLTSVELPNATSLSDYCFDGCTALTSVNLPVATGLGAGCLRGCTALTSVNLPAATGLGADCFSECSGLTSVEVPVATSLGSNCFYKCTSLTSIELPKVTAIGNYCFSNTNKLKDVVLGGVGNPITNTDNFSVSCMSVNVENLFIYVNDAINPPTLTGIPWNAGSAIITYEQA